MAKDDKILSEIKDRFKLAYDAVHEAYEEMVGDLNFLNGDQWEDSVLKDRDGRPSVTVNKLPGMVDRVNGDIRQNSPSIKIKPVDSESDPPTAEMLTGLIRNIEMQSAAEIAYDTAAESAVGCGKGTFRILTQYVGNDSFDQEIVIKRVRNPFSVFWDPNAQEWDRSDALYCFVMEELGKDEFEEKYPDASLQEFENLPRNSDFRGAKETIRVAEYYVKEQEKGKLYLVRDNETSEEFVVDGETPKEGLEVLQDREITTDKLVWYKTNGAEILEGPTPQPGKYIGIIEVYGKELNIENKSIYRGVTRHSKDSMRLYNYARSQNAEVTSLAPRMPWVITKDMVAGFESIWASAHKKVLGYLPWNSDSNVPGAKPFRPDPISANTGILAEMEISNQDLHDTVGLQAPSVGKESSSGSSGRKEIALQRMGDVGSFAYYDNLGRALKYAGKVMVDMIPTIYDTERVVRILGEDGSDEFIQLNKSFTDEETGEERIYDLSTGKYDVVVTVGPSYNTQREEAADGMLGLMDSLPDQARMLIADLVTKNMDWPGADEIAERLQFLLPPELQKDKEGKSIPQPQPSPEDPNIEAEAQEKLAKTDKLVAEAALIRQEGAERDLGFNDANPTA